ncbi:unnamed protein product [Timema podura]|uniref:Uncharacterized protein n=1 Tax=Timema podura TaxID=61482 RepID=A0ABN7NRB2_TIMPD|nr:unnamed protein product [Timema podura]
MAGYTIQQNHGSWKDEAGNEGTNCGITVYVLSNGDVPLYNTPLDHKITAKLGTITRKKIAINDVNNVPEVRYVSASQRRCRFHEENSLTTYPAYSYSACVVECRLRAQLHLCNCTTHFFPHFGTSSKRSRGVKLSLLKFSGCVVSLAKDYFQLWASPAHNCDNKVSYSPTALELGQPFRVFVPFVVDFPGFDPHLPAATFTFGSMWWVELRALTLTPIPSICLRPELYKAVQSRTELFST